MRKSKIAAVALLAAATLLTSACTFKQGHQATVSVGQHTRVYIYQKPTYQIAWELHDFCQSKHPSSRTAQGKCILGVLRDTVNIDGLQGVFWRGRFVNVTNTQASDIMEAIDKVRAAKSKKDSHGEAYAILCLTGDWITGSPNDANWTIRPPIALFPCHRGEYALPKKD